MNSTAKPPQPKPPRPEVRMLTKSELESLQRDKLDAIATIQAWMRNNPDRLKAR